MIPPLPCGTQTRWGTVSAVGTISGERYYWLIDRNSVMSLMPSDVVEKLQTREPKR